ncbi:hypothetical protein BC941DRAFT_516682 [Chlamydoabsidia padenii]|nr:hypothetical protein BC941DRAFT_516682 [Chlamydoabsidia padenii]
MPLRDVRRINTKLSNYFYDYGKACASRVTLLLVGTLCAICFLSLPTIHQFTQTVYSNAVPIPFSLDTFDGQFWLFSPHVQQQQPDLYTYTESSTTTSTTTTTTLATAPMHDITIKQVRITNLIQQVDKELLLYAYQLQKSLTATTIHWKENQVLSLESLCYRHQKNNKDKRHCLTHSPLVYWNSVEDLAQDTAWLETINYYQMGEQQRRQQPLNKINDSSMIITTPLSSTISADGLSMQPLSLFGNVTLDLHGNVVSADSIILTFFLRPDPYLTTPSAFDSKDDIDSAWNALWNKMASEINMDHLTTAENGNDNPSQSILMSKAWYQQANVKIQTWFYKFKLLPLELSLQMQVIIVSYLVIFYVVSTTFAKSTQVKSHYLFGLAALFLSTASCTTTLGILHHFGVELTVVPWYLYFIICGVASLENIFLMTNAVLYSGCDMQVKEKIARCLQSVGVPMTAMLFAEIFILSIGGAMDSVLVQEFCLFGKVALLVDYALEFTFFIAVLSIDVKRVELADLDDRQISKRLHELSTFDIDAQKNPDFCPIHDNPADEMQPQTCADCKEFKTHRAINAVWLCVVILGLCLFQRPHIPPSDRLSTNSLLSLPNPRPSDNDMISIANQFWTVINPSHDVWRISVLPPHLIVHNHPSLSERYGHSSTNFVQSILQKTEQHYLAKDKHYSNTANLLRSSRQSHTPPSLFRSFIYRTTYTILTWLWWVNIPLLLLCMMSAVVTMWLMPPLRRRWVVPAIKHVAIRIKLKLTSVIRGLLAGRTASMSAEYDANGVHFGAISAQEQFNEQHKSNITSVEIKTLMGKHVADLRLLGANGKHGTVVSCDQDGRIVLWDTVRSAWMARLDRLETTMSNGGALLGDLNPEYYSQPRRIKKWQRAFGAYQQKQLQLQHRQRSPYVNVVSGCVKIDQGNRWVIAAYDDGSIRVWNVMSGTLACQLNVNDTFLLPGMLEQDHNVAIYNTKHHQQQQHPSPHYNQNIRQRRNIGTSGSVYPNDVKNHNSTSNQQGIHYSTHNNGIADNVDKKARKGIPMDRTLAVQFIGVVAEYCHPLVAEIAAQQHTAAGQTMDPNTSQNYLVSVHKSGIIREWDIFSGECIQSFVSGHGAEITYLHSVECKAPHRKLGVTWVFTASKDGCVKCWERRLVKESSRSSSHTGTEADTRCNNNHTSTGSNSTSNSTSSSTNWTCLYSIEAHPGQAITSLATALPVGGMGILVTGTNQGSLKVWNFETGEPVCTLSQGLSVKSTFGNTRLQPISSQQPQQQIYDHIAGVTQIVVTRYCDVDTGPGLCRGCDTCFGNGFFVASNAMDDTVHVWRLERSGGGHEHNCNLCSKDYHRQQYRRTKKMAIAAATVDEDELPTTPTPGGRRRQQQNRQRKSSLSSASSSTTASTANLTTNSSAALSTNATSATSTIRRIRRHRPNVRLAANSPPMEDMMKGLLDIEQLADDGEINLVSVFLGKVHQVAGRSLVFCDNMILAGVRKKPTPKGSKSSKHNMTSNYKMTEWETWFASLQYYEPPSDMVDNTELPLDNNNRKSGFNVNQNRHAIPLEVFGLDPSLSSEGTPLSHATKNMTPLRSNTNSASPPSIWKRLVYSLFGNTSTGNPTRPSNNDKVRSNIYTNDNDDDEDEDDEDDEAGEDEDSDYAPSVLDDDEIATKEMLPFSAIHHVVPMDGLGFACDYGNFIKVVCLDNEKLAALRRQQQQVLLSDHPMFATDNKYCIGGTWSKGCDSGTTDDVCTISNSPHHNTSGDSCQCKSDGVKCCGGKNKKNGVCCSGKSNKGSPTGTSTARYDPAALYDSTTNTSTMCQTRSVVDCPSKSICSRASDCHPVSSASRSIWNY